MASTPATKLRIAASVLFAVGFWDAVAGYFAWENRWADSEALSNDNPQSGWLDWRGALHVHSTYSDGASDIPTIMAAADEAMVDFVLLTDHNTMQPKHDGWEDRYVETPLLLIGTEVTVEHGAFLLALDLSPNYEPERGVVPQSAIDRVLDDGGLPLVSLPFDVKHPWTAWETSGYEGLEVLNLSTIARRHINLLSLLFLFPIYKTGGMMAAMRALVTRPDASIERWDDLLQDGQRKMVGLGSLDAHALMKIGKRKYPIPSYADSFRAATTHVLLPLTVKDADANEKRRAIYEALRLGRCYFAYDCLGNPHGFTFTARNGNASATMGETILRDSDGSLKIEACSAESNLLLRLYHNGKTIAASPDGHISCTIDQPGAYRIEGYRYTFRAGSFFVGVRPWLFGNPIYVE